MDLVQWKHPQVSVHLINTSTTNSYQAVLGLCTLLDTQSDLELHYTTVKIRENKIFRKFQSPVYEECLPDRILDRLVKYCKSTKFMHEAGTKEKILVEKPRGIRLEGSFGCGIAYHNVAVDPVPMFPLTRHILDYVMEKTRQKFNNAQIACCSPYSTVQEGSSDTVVGIKWHCDTGLYIDGGLEELVKQTVVCTLNLFEVANQGTWGLAYRQRTGKKLVEKILFGHGDMYMQGKGLQHHAVHQSFGAPLIGFHFIFIFRCVLPGYYLQELARHPEKPQHTLNMQYQLANWQWHSYLELQRMGQPTDILSQARKRRRSQQKDKPTTLFGDRPWHHIDFLRKGYCHECKRSCGGSCRALYTGFMPICVGSKFMKKQDIINLGLAVCHSKSVEGSQVIGATSVIVTKHNNFDNEFFYNEKNKLVKIITEGTGGRELSTETHKYEDISNQLLQQNYPLLQSASINIPIHVFMKNKEDIYEYLGLWLCDSFSFCKQNRKDHKSYKFVLLPAV